ncbi:MAG: hypothetical protein VXZ32_02910 [Verrucomicrobiota bacterium]|nr:hypothetical protein [Verrucomicrobiota bacterium]
MKKILGLLLTGVAGAFTTGPGLDFGSGEGAPGAEPTGGGEDGLTPGDIGGGGVEPPVRLGKGLGARVGEEGWTGAGAIAGATLGAGDGGLGAIPPGWSVGGDDGVRVGVGLDGAGDETGDGGEL